MRESKGASWKTRTQTQQLHTTVSPSAQHQAAPGTSYFTLPDKTDCVAISKPRAIPTAAEPARTAKINQPRQETPTTWARPKGSKLASLVLTNLVNIDNFFGGVHAVVVLPIAVLLVLGRPHPATTPCAKQAKGVSTKARTPTPS